jgi:hypothetical protein
MYYNYIADLSDEGCRGDIHTGELYRQFVESIDRSSYDKLITGQLNCDGANCHKNSKFVIWPFMCLLNECTYRSRRSNIILMALFYGNKKPPRNPFLQNSIVELKKLGTTGFIFNEKKYLFKPLILTTDTMARPVFTNCTQCNGLEGCNFCLHPGKYVLFEFLFARYVIIFKNYF